MAKAKKLPSGNWRVNQYIGKDESGKRIYKSFTAPTALEAEFIALEYLRDSNRIKKPQNLTVQEAIQRYVDSKSAVLSPSTIREYVRMAGTMLPGLSCLPLNKINNELIQIEVNREALTLSSKTIANHVGLLNAALSVYLPDFRIRVSLPKRVKKEAVIPKRDELLRLIADTKGTDMEIAILLAAFNGLRRGEIAALHVNDIDFKNGLIHINKSMVLNSKKEWVIKAPKTYAGSRTESLSTYVLTAVNRKRGLEGRLVHLTPAQITDRFTKLRNKLNMQQVSFHKLRHYFASMMHELNIPDKYAMKRMGHTTDNMLKMVYQHVIDEKDKEIDAQINDRINQFMQHEMQHEK